MPTKRRRELVHKPKGELSTKRPWQLILVTVAFLFAAVCFAVTQKYKSAPYQIPHYKIRNVTVLDKPVGISYQMIAEWRVPLILHNTVLDKWPASRAFTTQFLSQKIEMVSVHSQETKRSFITFHDNKPLEPLVLDSTWNDFNNKIELTIPELLRWDAVVGASLDTGPWYYYSQDVAQLKNTFTDVLTYLQPINELILSEDNVQVNLWIGRAGIITHTHYDATYNFFMQLQGRKRFTLFPPNQTLYLYPCLHPHYGHSQLDIREEPSASQYPLFRGAEAVVAEVGPGDMLVVPPYWFHHVETLEESVSVNVWSDAPEYDLMNQIYSKSIPFEEAWGWAELTIATHIYLTMLLEPLKFGNARVFISQLALQRYQPLMHPKPRLKFNRECGSKIEALFSSVDWASKVEHYQPLLQRGIDELTPLFLQIPGRSTIRICVGNYVEHLVHQVVGLDCVYPFLNYFGSS